MAPGRKKEATVVGILLPLALLANGLAAGGLAISVLASPLFRSLPTAMYVPVHQGLVTRFDPFMPITLVGALLSDVALAVAEPRAVVRLTSALAAALLATAISVSLKKNVPVNRWLATLDAERLPADWDRLDPRDRWIRWNRVRGSLAAGAFLANVSTAAFLL